LIVGALLRTREHPRRKKRGPETPEPADTLPTQHTVDFPFFPSTLAMLPSVCDNDSDSRWPARQPQVSAGTGEFSGSSLQLARRKLLERVSIPMGRRNPTMLCKGVDLTHPQWILAGASITANRNEPLVPAERANGSGWPTEMILDTPRSSPWVEIEESLLLAATPEIQTDLVRDQLITQSTLIDRKVFANAARKELWVAFAFPYQTAPLVRMELHNLFSYQFLKEQPREQRCAIEAPIALLIECVAQSKVEPDSGSCVLLLTGTPPRTELTGARLTRQGNTLHIGVTAYAAIDPDNLPASVGRLAGNHAYRHLFHAASPDQSQAVAKALMSSSGACEIVDMGRQAIAVGAMRYGGLLRAQQWVGRQVSGVEVERILPAAVGVLGTNKHEEWFWRRLFDRGMKLAQDPIPSGLRSGVPAPERVFLAECTHPNFEAPRWLAQQDWPAARLRAHGAIENREKLDDWDLELSMVNKVQQWNRLRYPRWKIVETQ
jgi:hypothetical protein